MCVTVKNQWKLQGSLFVQTGCLAFANKVRSGRGGKDAIVADDQLADL